MLGEKIVWSDYFDVIDDDFIINGNLSYKDIYIPATKYMSNESYIINEPKFVVTTNNAPIVSVVGHPLTETFAVKTEDGESKWLGLFVETEEFAKLCAQSGITVNQLKKYIITTSEEQHVSNLEKHDPIAEFINKQKITNEIFKT